MGILGQCADGRNVYLTREYNALTVNIVCVHDCSHGHLRHLCDWWIVKTSLGEKAISKVSAPVFPPRRMKST